MIFFILLILTILVFSYKPHYKKLPKGKLYGTFQSAEQAADMRRYLEYEKFVVRTMYNLNTNLWEVWIIGKFIETA